MSSRAGLRWLPLLVVLVASCGAPEKPAKPEPGVDRPATPAEIQAQFDAILQPIYHLVATATPDSVVPPELWPQVRAQLEERRKQVSALPAYKQGVQGTVKRLEDGLRTARDAQNGALVLLLCDVIRFFDPDNSRLLRFQKWGEMVRNRPVVTIRGWYEPRDTEVRTVYAFLEVYTPEDGQTHFIQVQEDEVFFNLRYYKMIGNKQGIVLEYLPTGDQFDVYSPSWKRRQQ